MLLWVQYQFNNSRGALAVLCSVGMLLWVQYHVNTCGGVITVVAVWYVLLGAVPC